MNMERYRSFFEEIYHKYNNLDFVDTDPIVFYYNSPGNKEFTAFIASLFAYGKVSLIQKFLSSFFSDIGYQPVGIEKTSLYYRFQKPNDIVMLNNYLFEIYEKFGSLENYFLNFSDNLEEAFFKFYESVKDFGSKYNAGQGFYFLFSNSLKSGAKRFCMFFRWMVRDDDVDPGIWKRFSPTELIFPIDTHIIRFSHRQGIIKSQSNTYKNSIKITEFFRQINPQDPVKYDFSITRLGMLHFCEYIKTDKCLVCPHHENCPF